MEVITYYSKNKTVCNEKAKKYYNEHKEQYKKNREENPLYIIKYRIDNKDILNKKFGCKCGGKYTKTNLSQHKKTMKHIKFITN